MTNRHHPVATTEDNKQRNEVKREKSVKKLKKNIHSKCTKSAEDSTDRSLPSGVESFSSSSPPETPSSTPEVPDSSEESLSTHQTDLESKSDPSRSDDLVKEKQSLILSLKTLSPLSSHLIKPSEMLHRKRAPSKNKSISEKDSGKSLEKDSGKSLEKDSGKSSKNKSISEKDSGITDYTNEFQVKFTHSENLPPPLPKKEYVSIVVNDDHHEDPSAVRKDDDFSEYETIEKSNQVSSKRVLKNVQSDPVAVHSQISKSRTLTRKKKDRKPPPAPQQVSRSLSLYPKLVRPETDPSSGQTDPSSGQFYANMEFANSDQMNSIVDENEEVGCNTDKSSKNSKNGTKAAGLKKDTYGNCPVEDDSKSSANRLVEGDSKSSGNCPVENDSKSSEDCDHRPQFLISDAGNEYVQVKFESKSLIIGTKPEKDTSDALVSSEIKSSISNSKSSKSSKCDESDDDSVLSQLDSLEEDNRTKTKEENHKGNKTVFQPTKNTNSQVESELKLEGQPKPNENLTKPYLSRSDLIFTEVSRNSRPLAIEIRPYVDKNMVIERSLYRVS